MLSFSLILKFSDKILFALSTLKVKQPVILPAKWVYSENSRKLQYGTCKLWQSIDKSGDQIKECYFIDKMKKLGGAPLNDRVHGRRETVQGSDSFSLAELWYSPTGCACCLARRNSSSSGIQSRLLPFGACSWWGVVGSESSPLAFQFRIKWGFLYLFSHLPR